MKYQPADHRALFIKRMDRIRRAGSSDERLTLFQHYPHEFSDPVESASTGDRARSAFEIKSSVRLRDAPGVSADRIAAAIVTMTFSPSAYLGRLVALHNLL